MTPPKGHDLLLRIGDGGAPEGFALLGSARTVALALANHAADGSALDAGGVQRVQPGAGMQSLEIALEGAFCNTAAEDRLRAAAFAASAASFQLQFPNGDLYAASFVVVGYHRGRAADGTERFAVTLQRSGSGVFTPAAP